MPLRCTAELAGSRCAGGVDGACVAKRFLQDCEPALQLLVRRGERRQQTDHVAVETAGEKDEPALPRGRGDRLRRVAALLRELEREHRPETAHIADDRMLPRDLVEPRPKELRDLLRTL